MADESIGTARIDIIVNTDQFDTAVSRARTLTSGMGDAAQAAWVKMDSAAKRNATSLLRWAENLGKTAEEQKLLNGAMRGVPIELLEEVRQKILANRDAQQAQAQAAKAAADAILAEAEAAKSLALAQQAAASAAQRAYDQRTQAILAERAALESIAQSRQRDLDLAQQTNAAAGQRAYAANTQALLAERAATDALAAARQRDFTIMQQSNAAAGQRAASSQVQSILEERAALASLADARVRDLAATAQANAAAGRQSYERNTQALLAERSAMERTTAARNAFIAGLESQAGAVGKTRADLLELQAAQLGVSGAAVPFIAKLRAQEAELGVNAKTARELNFALRGLPAQFTDIGVSLASGQRPMLVLLQQGGQLKDMFGGIAPALRAVGSGVMAMINPLTIGVAAAAALAFAWKEGSDEAVAYNKALITTGNYAGVTTDRMGQMAKAIGDAVGTQHEAAAALAEVAASGKFTGEQIQLVGKAALEMSRMTGQATSETIKQFESLQDKPLEAILKLNDAQHFLTTAIYEQIKALEDQGRTQEAANLATDIYADTVDKRSKEAVENLGLVEKAWRGIKDATLAAGSAIAGIGRDQTEQMKFDALAVQRNRLLAEQAKGVKFDVNSGRDIQSMIDDATKKMATMQDKLVAAQKEASKKAIAAEATQALIDSDKEAAIYATKEEKRVKEVLAAHNKANAEVEKALAAGDKASAERIRTNEAKIVAGIEAKYADKSTGSTKSPRTKETPNFRVQDMKLIEAEIAAEGKLMDQRTRGEAAVAAYKTTLDDMLQTRQAQIDLDVASFGMGQQEIEQTKARIAIDADYDRKAADLQKRQQSTSDAVEKQFYAQQLADLKAYHDARVQMEEDGAKRAAAAQADGMNGVRSALKDFMDEQKDMAGQMRSLTTDLIGGFGDAFAKFVSGTESAKDAFGSLIDSMYQQALKAVANKAIQSILDSFGLTSNPTLGSTQGGWSSLFGNFLNGFNPGGGGFGPGTIGAGLAAGGPASAGSIHPVVENGPELLNVGSKTYLMMGSQSGHVTPIGDSKKNAANSPTYITNINVQPTSTRRTAEQVATANARTQRIAQSRNG